MMIWCSYFFSFLLMKMKPFYFFSNLLELDFLSIFLASICPLVLLLIFSLNYNYFLLYESYQFFCLFVFTIFSVFFFFFFRSPFYLLLSLEFCVVPMLTLIFVFSKGVDKIISVFFMFMINNLGSVPFMVFYFFFLDYFLNFFMISFKIIWFENYLIFILFSLIFLCKLPMFLFHFWLVKAHVSASGSCSMLLASLMLKLGTFGILKFSKTFLKVSSMKLPYFFSISTLGTFLILLAMIRFFDAKYMIACSSVIHMSMIIPLTFFNFSIGLISNMYMMLGHGIVSFILFYLISIYYEICQNRTFDFNKCLESLSKNCSMLIFIYMFLNLGLPPFMNFFSEVFIFFIMCKFSILNMFLMIFIMILPIIFCMHLLTKVLFGKITFCLNSDLSFSVVNYSIMFIIFLFIYPFIFF